MKNLQEKLAATRWDLIVVDEAHKMSASFYGNKLEEDQALQARQAARLHHAPLPVDDRHAAQR
jgi:superfamily II DNA or RNA helicase